MNRAIVVALTAVSFCTVAMADLSGHVGWTDPESLITWQGVSELKAEKESVPGTYIWADVQWVVEWDAPAGQFHYMYQVTNKGDYDITLLAVPMLASNEAVNIGSFATSLGEIAPSAAAFVPLPPEEATQAAWSFDGLNKPSSSYALDYWSVNKPLALGGFIQDGGVFAVSGDLPSPDNAIPEPACMSLLAVGALALLRRRRA